VADLVPDQRGEELAQDRDDLLVDPGVDAELRVNARAEVVRRAAAAEDEPPVGGGVRIYPETVSFTSSAGRRGMRPITTARRWPGR